MTSSAPRPLLDHTPADGSLTDVVEGIMWLRLPLPFALNHVNVWLLSGSDHTLAAVDTGFAMPDNQDAWLRTLETFSESKKLTDLFITHYHPDHIGLAGWVADLYPEARRYITAREEKLARALCDEATLAAWLPVHVDGYKASGLDDARLNNMIKRVGGYKHVVTPLPASFTTIRDSDIVKLGGNEWQVIEGFGHSPEHASLYCAARDVFIAGDMVLPYISPNIALSPRDSADADPLAGFLDSLARIKTLVPDSALVLPSHGVPFYGLHDRIDTLIAHHHERCGDVAAIIGDSEMSGADIMAKLFIKRDLDGNTLFFALGETLSHIRYMMKRNRLRARTDSNGVILYSNI